MATFHEKYHGWEWSTEERRSRQTKLRHLRQTKYHVHRWTWWIGNHLPQFKEQAAQAKAHLEKGLGKAADIDLSNRGRKYQPVSPEQLDQAFASMLDLLKPWQELFGDTTFAAARKQKEREIRAHNVIAREEWAKAEEIFRMIDAGNLFGAIDKAAKEGLL